MPFVSTELHDGSPSFTEGQLVFQATNRTVSPLRERSKTVPFCTHRRAKQTDMFVQASDKPDSSEAFFASTPVGLRPIRAL